MTSNSSTPQKWEARRRKISLFHARARTHALYPLTLRILIQPEYDGFVVIVQCVCVYYCSTYYKAVRVCGGGNNGGHMLRETTSRGLCGLVCPSRTSERGGEGYCASERRRGRRRGA